jgi:Na+/H+-dicarboxylate symporter
MKKFFKSLLPRIIIAIILGLLLGFITPEFIVKIFTTINGIFSNFLGFCIPLIIVGLVVSGIGELGKGAGKLLLLTVILAYGSTLFSGIFTFLTSSAIYPFIIDSSQTGVLSNTHQTGSGLSSYFTIQMPPVFDVMTALVFSFLVGIGISFLEGETLKNFFREFKQIIEKVITVVIIPFLPFYIFGIFLNMSYNGEAYEIITVFGKVITYIIILSFVLLIIQFTFAGLITKRNPFTALKTMLPAYMTALGTASSAATIPVTLAQAKKNGVAEDIADFCIPLCATIHLSGSTMKIVGTSMAIIILQGESINFITYLGFIMMLGITMVAAPGVPGGAIMAAIAILQSILGFNEQAIALIIAVYVAIDSFGTACNVTGDGAISLVVNRFKNRLVS